MPNNPLLLYAAGAAAIVGFASGWTVRDWKCDAAKLAAERAAEKVEDKAEAAVDASATGYEGDRAAISQTATIERNTVREIYRNVEVPSDCAADPAGRGLLDTARQRADAAASGKLGAAVRSSASGTPAADRP